MRPSSSLGPGGLLLRTVEKLRAIGRADHETVGIVHLEKLEKRVQDTPDLTDVIGTATLSAKSEPGGHDAVAAAMSEKPR